MVELIGSTRPSALAGFMAPSMPTHTSRVAASKVYMSSPVVDEVMDKLKAMTLLEASDLVKAIEETFGVDASASAGPAMMMAAPGAAAPAAEAAEEPFERRIRQLTLSMVTRHFRFF